MSTWRQFQGTTGRETLMTVIGSGLEWTRGRHPVRFMDEGSQRRATDHRAAQLPHAK